jgi:hypothetical protein
VFILSVVLLLIAIVLLTQFPPLEAAVNKCVIRFYALKLAGNFTVFPVEINNLSMTSLVVDRLPSVSRQTSCNNTFSIYTAGSQSPVPCYYETGRNT